MSPLKRLAVVELCHGSTSEAYRTIIKNKRSAYNLSVAIYILEDHLQLIQRLLSAFDVHLDFPPSAACMG